MNKILITDSLFIFPEHEQRLRDAGYEPVRLDKPSASEADLAEAVKGKVGYIIGGIESVTKPVLGAADQLKAIAFAGTGWQGFIPAWEYATEKGISISNAPSGNAPEVAEWGIAAMMAMQRNLFSLGPQGKEKFTTVKGLSQLEVGVVGLGNIGREFAERATGLRARQVSYWSREKKTDEYKYYDELDNLLSSADIVFLCVGDDAGQNFIDQRRIGLMKDGALLVSIIHKGIFDEDALYERLAKGTLRAAFDVVKDVERFRGLPSNIWYGSNGTAAYNVDSAHRRVSDMATNSILNLLKDGSDQYKVN
jgi:D-3-phosphoglycerate dehydrogenase / 2-oxoglutarate reductase